jgi:polysaccharide pyruvyl transferase WcaK-like protein
LIVLARLSGTGVVCYQIGAGPITTFAGRQLFRLGAQMANAISVRDAESERVLRRIGVRRDIAVQADPALLLEPAAADNLPLQRDTGDGMRVGIAPVPYFAQGLWYGTDADEFDRYVAKLAAFADTLLEEYQAVPVFLRFSRGDDVTARAIQERMRGAQDAVVLPQEYDPRQLLTLVGHMDLFVGTRLHSLIFATVMKVPCIAIAYQEKVRNYMHAVGQGDRVLEIDSFSVQGLIEQFDRLYRDRAQVRGQLEHGVQLLQDQARQGVGLMADVLAERIR